MADALLVSSSFLPGRGGIESYLAELCGALAPRVAVLAAGERDGKPLPSDLQYATHPFAGRLLFPGPRAAAAIERAAGAEATDRVIFGTPWPLVLLAPRLAARGLRYSVIVHGAEMTVPAAVPGVRRKLASALAGAELLLPVSEYTADQLGTFLAKMRHDVPPIDVLRAHVDVERFKPDTDSAAARARLGLAPDDKVILCFGRLVKRKGVHRLIEALPEIRRRVPHATLVIAGDGPERKRLERQASALGGRVVFAGRVPDEDAPGVYAIADVFALPVVDRWFGLEIEGLGVVLLEAAACGTPCVTGRSGGTPEAVIDGETGFVVDVRDRTQLVEKIAWLLQHPDEAATMGAAGRRHVEATFSRRTIPRSLLDWVSGRGLAG